MMHRQESTITRSSAVIIGGNDDLLTEILIFLPAKSLIRFKLVSKHWRSLISAPSFHHRRRRAQLSIILGGVGSQFFICNPTIRKLVPFSFPFSFVKILQSCNGLLLLECRNSPYGRKGHYIFNPTTMQYRNLYLSKDFSGLCLIFDPSQSYHYRVVCFTSVKNCTSFHVYDSETRIWKYSGKCDHGPYKFHDGVYWNSCLYFIRFYETSICFFPKYGNIYLAPDPPRIWSDGSKKDYIVESNGHFHCLSLYSKPDVNILYVLEMNVDNDWFVNCRGDNSPLSAKFAGNNAEMDLLGMIRGERAEDSMLLYHVPGKILIYRFSDEVIEVLIDFTREAYFKQGQLQFGFKDAHPFIENFAPV